MLRVRAQGKNSPLHTPPATHRRAAFWAKDCSCIFATNGPREMHLVWTVFWNQLPVWPYATSPGIQFGKLTVCFVKINFLKFLKLPDVSPHTMRNNLSQFSFTLPLPLMTFKSKFLWFPPNSATGPAACSCCHNRLLPIASKFLPSQFHPIFLALVFLLPLTSSSIA